MADPSVINSLLSHIEGARIADEPIDALTLQAEEFDALVREIEEVVSTYSPLTSAPDPSDRLTLFGIEIRRNGGAQ